MKDEIKQPETGYKPENEIKPVEPNEVPQPTSPEIEKENIRTNRPEEARK